MPRALPASRVALRSAITHYVNMFDVDAAAHDVMVVAILCRCLFYYFLLDFRYGFDDEDTIDHMLL